VFIFLKLFLMSLLATLSLESLRRKRRIGTSTELLADSVAVIVIPFYRPDNTAQISAGLLPLDLQNPK
jgi:hypothetical protein